MDEPLDKATLTAGQLRRRERVIAAATELAAEGGYDAVQMRDVAARANVALGTIYRYFSSKDHLLGAAMLEWTGALQRRLRDVPPRGETSADQLVDILRRASRSMERQSRLSAALVTALSSADPAVGECAHEVNVRIGDMTAHILEGFDPQRRADILAVIGHVWNSTLLAWANGRSDIARVGDELERAARLLLGGTRPAGRREANGAKAGRQARR